MPKFLLFLFFLFLIPACFYGQDTQKQLNTIRDSVYEYVKRETKELVADSTDGNKYLSRKAYSRFFDKYFTQISYEKETFTDGNSASLKFSDNETKATLTLSKKSNSSIFSIGTALNVTDKTGTLFSGKKPTAGTQFFLNHSILISPRSSLKFDDEAMATNYRHRRFILDSITSVHILRNPASLPVLTHKLQEAKDKLDSLQRRLAQLQNLNKTPDASVSASIVECQEALISAAEAKDKVSNDLQGLLLRKPLRLAIKDIYKEADEKSVQRELSTEGVTTFKMQWLTTGLSYKRDNYATYDSSLAFSDRVDEKSFDNYAVAIGYNTFWQRTDMWIERNGYKGFNSLYGSITYSIANSNNYSTIDETNLNIVKTVNNRDTTYELSTSQKLREISGVAFTRTWVHKIGLQGTGMLGKKQFSGLNLIANTELANTRKPVFNTHVGWLFRFIDSFDEKSKVNFEVFFAFNDMTDTKEDGKSVWQRKEIGITASVPFGKVFFR